MPNADAETDLFELELRRKDASRNVMVGVALVIVAGVLFVVGGVALYLAVTATTGEVRFPLAIFGGGVFLGLLGVGSIAQGIQKRKAAQDYAKELRGRVP